MHNYNFSIFFPFPWHLEIDPMFLIMLLLTELSRYHDIDTPVCFCRAALDTDKKHEEPSSVLALMRGRKGSSDDGKTRRSFRVRCLACIDTFCFSWNIVASIIFLFQMQKGNMPVWFICFSHVCFTLNHCSSSARLCGCSILI